MEYLPLVEFIYFVFTRMPGERHCRPCNNQTALCKAIVTHSESLSTGAQWVSSEAENSAILLPL